MNIHTELTHNTEIARNFHAGRTPPAICDPLLRVKLPTRAVIAVALASVVGLVLGGATL